ncbi:MAG TPA: hypothetical protein VKU60_16270, partial [Chloroflexota bacterium]|nr:hypothetical protein [Chloroflexota bacterium]
AKLLLNWLLTKEGQTVYVQKTGYNVRRLDAPIGNPDEVVPDPNKDYFDLNIEKNYPIRVKAMDIAKQELK